MPIWIGIRISISKILSSVLDIESIGKSGIGSPLVYSYSHLAVMACTVEHLMLFKLFYIKVT